MMHSGKNLFIYITSVFAAVVLVFYVFMIFGYQSGFFKDAVSFTDDGSIVIMGKSHKPDKRFSEALENYSALCEKASSELFPDIVTVPIKETAASLMKAANDIFVYFGNILSEITHGNM